MMPDTTSGNASRIMVCTGDAQLGARLQEELHARGYASFRVAHSDAALSQLAAAPPDAMLCDQELPGHEGMALVQMIRRERLDLAAMPIILMSNFGERADIVAGKLAGADDYIVKPVDTELLIASVVAQLRLTARMRAATAGDASSTPGIVRLKVLHRLMDRLSFGVVLYDGQGQPIFVNRVASQLSRTSSATIRSGIMRRAVPGARQNGAALPASPHPSVLDFRMIPVGVSGSNTAQHLFVATLDLSEADSPETVVAAVIFPSVHDGVLGTELVAHALGLTPAESRLASLLAEGLRLEEIGGIMGIAKPTVNYHLRNIYQKSGSSRQSELINLLRAVHLARPLGE